MNMNKSHSKFFLVSLLIVGLSNLYGSDKSSSRQSSKIPASGKQATTERLEKQNADIPDDISLHSATERLIKQKDDAPDDISVHSAPKATGPEQYLSLTLEQRQRVRLLSYATVCGGHKRKKSPRASRIAALSALRLYGRWAEQTAEDPEQEVKNYTAINTFFDSENSEDLLEAAQEDLEELIEGLKAAKTQIEESLTILTGKKRK